MIKNYAFERKQWKFRKRINSFPIITNNKYFKCIEFFNIDKKPKYGIQIYEINNLWEVLDNQIIVNIQIL